MNDDAASDDVESLGDEAAIDSKETGTDRVSPPGGEADKKPEAGPQTPSPPWVTIIGFAFTFLAAFASALFSYQTNKAVESSRHAEAFAQSFTTNFSRLTNYYNSTDRSAEESADLALTAINDEAVTLSDKVTMLTIAARMLNVASCPSVGERTARFLSVAVERLKLEGSDDSAKLLRFVRSHPFLDLAASDIATTYYNDDSTLTKDACPASSPSPVAPLHAGNQTSPSPKSFLAGTSPSVAPPRKPKGLGIPPADDHNNHATIWGEQASWNDAKNELFRELRPNNWDGWIHIATWELPDECTQPGALTCRPIRVDYSSSGVTFSKNDEAVLSKPFWLGRARYLRDAAPRIYVHALDSDLGSRGVLGRVIGVVDAGECVERIEAPRYYEVSIARGSRKFEHMWLHVKAADDSDCSVKP